MDNKKDELVYKVSDEKNVTTLKIDEEGIHVKKEQLAE